MKLNKLKLGLAGIILAGSLNGCFVFKNVRHDFVLKKYNPLTAEQKDSLFKDLNPELKECLKKVYIIDKKDLEKNVSAHTHHDKFMTMCFSKYSKDDSETRFHESAHTKHLSLDKNHSDFSEKWKEIANFKYGLKNIIYLFNEEGEIIHEIWKSDSAKNSKEGILSPIFSKKIYEDVAGFVECLSYGKEPKDIEKIDTNGIKDLEEQILKAKSDIDSYRKEKDQILSKKTLSSLDSVSLELCSLIIKLSSDIIEYDSSSIEYEKRKPFVNALELVPYYPLYFADTTDHRYQKKIDLLKEYNFLTNEEHEKLSKNLGSLNYLLKQEKGK